MVTPARRAASAQWADKRGQVGWEKPTCATQPGAEKGFGAGEGAVDILIHDDEIAGAIIFAQGAYGGDGDDIRAAQPFERVDIGAVGHV